jgi:hypothetical protein
MYVRVPRDLKDPLIKEIRQLRVRSYIKYYPIVVILFAAVALLFVFERGHPLYVLFRRYIPLEMSDTVIAVLTSLVVFVLTAMAIVYFMRKDYLDCDCQECLYCRKCDAVDKFDSGSCSVCGEPLTEKALFYFTTSKDEQKIIERWGLQPSKQG